MFETFVYSPRVEGVHLRTGKVARGGLRWSDRLEDYRTEVLGLMKAQAVKNAVIVPGGAKGGFVLKAPPAGDADALQAEAVSLLPDVRPRPPRPRRQPRGRRGRAARPTSSATTQTTRTSSSLPTKGPPRSPTSPTTSRRSTTSGWATPLPPAGRPATTIRRWASRPGALGCRSSDTSATSAWTPTTKRSRVVGIGDMSGDVFGNGMLLSRHLEAGGGVRPPPRVPRPGSRS